MSEVLVNVEQGQLKGKVENDYADKKFYSFMGIPYAKPPLGELRFKAPQPPLSWTGTRDATEEPPQCYARHMVTFAIGGSEDCLYLNVYSPRLLESDSQNAAPLPVIFWIHGGAFLHGSSKRELYSPEFLMEHNVVLVTINYRVGLLGFLSFDDPSLEVPGNAGLKDMVMALQWVQKNIAQFSGDPKNVTIFGESAGGAAVEYLTLSPLATGLFHRGIMHSGSVLCPWASGKHTLETLSNALEVKTNNAAEILGILKHLPTEELLRVQEKIPTTPRAEPLIAGPVVENVRTPGAFLTDSPLNILKSGKYNRVPLLFLYNKYEGIAFEIIMSKLGLPAVHSKFEDYVPRCLQLKQDGKDFRALAEEIKRFYYSDKEPSPETKEEYYNLETDFLFLDAIYNTIRIRLTTKNKDPIYFCRFSLDAGLNFYKKINNATHLKGASHVDELGYIFKSSITPTYIPFDSIEGKTVKRITKLWTNFAKYGSPTRENDSLINIEWKPVEADHLHYLEIDEELTTGVNPDYDRIAFWDEIYRKYGGQDNRLFNFNKL